MLQPNINYWVAFTDPGCSTLAVEPGGLTLPTARRIHGAWQSGSGEAMKLRLCSNQLDDLDVAPIGSGGAGSGGRTGSRFTNATPRIGSSFYLESTGLPAGTLALMILGASPNWLSFPIPGGGPGCMLDAEPRIATNALGLMRY